MASAFISYRRDATGRQWAGLIQQRLEAAGFDVWRDVEQIAPGDRWRSKIADALRASSVVLCVMTAAADASDWVDEELHYARSLGLLIVPLQVEAQFRAPFGLGGVQCLDLHADDVQAWRSLLDLVGRHLGARTPHTAPSELERVYLDRLLYAPQRGVAQLAPVYTELAGVGRRVHSMAKALPVDLMPMLYRYRTVGAMPLPADEDMTRFNDVLDVFGGPAGQQRLALLGEPGAGKSFALRRIAGRFAQAALADPAAPIPLLVELGKWTDEAQSFRAFVGESIEPLAPALDALLDTRRVLLLLDALNEIPTAQQAHKVPQIGPWLHDDRLAGLVVSCREKDFSGPLQLDIDRLTIEPLDTPRIRTCIQRYYAAILPERADERAERLLWRLAQTNEPHRVDRVHEGWRRASDEGRTFADFWGSGGSGLHDDIRAIESDPRSLLAVARNPYLLVILFGLDLNDRLPPHGERRAQIFQLFVDDLLQRERDNHRRMNDGAEPRGEPGLLLALGKLAWALQHAGEEHDGVHTTIHVPMAERYLSADQLRHAVAASLVDVRGHRLGFTHHLLQEYFAAAGLQHEIEAQSLAAGALWPEKHWWRPLGWEEVIHTLAGLYADRPQRLIEWLGQANPEVLADALIANRLLAPCRPLLEEKRSAWIARMVDPKAEPRPQARAAIGRALGRMELDDRRGVGLLADGLPDIEWKRIPGTAGVPAFAIARFPITNAQFAAFVAADGYADARWWPHAQDHASEPRTGCWSEPNRPRESVSWDEAVAYCHWLSDALGDEARLPTRSEWSRAARGPRRRRYPWGNRYAAGRANVDETGLGGDPETAAPLAQTSAVGIFPHGSSPFGVEDLCGNVWEWCADDDTTDGRGQLLFTRPKVVCGGAWISKPAAANLADADQPHLRSHFTGFRVCRS